MTTRNERIAERIWELNPPMHTSSYADGYTDATGTIAKQFERGDFDDLLGPEVTAEVLEDFAFLGMTYAGLSKSVRCEIGLMRELDPEDRSEFLVAIVRFRRLAKFMRALERSAK